MTVINDAVTAYHETLQQTIKQGGYGRVPQGSRRKKRYRASDWTPAEIPTALWLDAADTDTITEAAGFVSQWDDKSGNGNHFTQAVGTAQPTTGTRKINGLNVLGFGGLAWMRTFYSQHVNPTDFTLFIVLISENEGDAVSVFNVRGASANGFILYHKDGRWTGYVGDGVDWDHGKMQGSVVTNKPTMIGLYADRNGSGLWVDGGVATQSVGYKPNSDRPFYIGTADFGLPWSGVVAEIILVPAVLDIVNRLKFESYLTAKWAIPSAYPNPNWGWSVSDDWSPNEIETVLWLDAADSGTITETAGFVSQWDDKSGNGYHFTQSVGTAQPATGVANVNSINAIDFDGGVQRFLELTTTEEIDVSGSICFAVIKTLEYDELGMILASRTVNNQCLRRATLGGYLPSLSYHDSVRTEYASREFTFGTPELLAVSYGSSSAGIYINGVLELVGVFSGSMAVSQIGRLQTSTLPNHFCVAEIIITAENSGVTRQRVEYYLKTKWRLRI